MSAKKVYQPTPSGRQHTLKVKYNYNKSNRARSILIGLGLAGVSLISAAAGALLAVTFSFSSPLQQAELTPAQKAVFSEEETVAQKSLTVPELSRPVNILVLGIKVLTSDLDLPPEEDLGYHALVNSFEGLSDTMLLLRFDPKQEKLTVLSIPRDTRVSLPGYGVQKINIANDFGGPALTAEAVSELLNGVNIDRYVRVNVQGIEKLIDALGGVTVYVPRDMKYTDHSQHLYINLKQGKQHLDGEKAAQFLRFRYDAFGDIGRVQRQQMLMRAVVEQTLQPSTLVKIPKILSVVQSHLDTNLTLKELMALAGFGAKLQRADVQMLMLPGEFNGDGRTEISYWLPNRDRIEKLVARHFTPTVNVQQLEQLNSLDRYEYKEPKTLQVAIQDSVDDPQAVQEMVEHLRKAGYTRVYVSDNWHRPLTKTQIVAQAGDNELAASVHATLGIGEILVESTGVLASDLTIVIGEDWREQIHINKTFEDRDENNFNHL
ncbi:LCP family protein [Pleurocapsales cyanobacterium LEGE 06147]|nr:LCP family protein [Pleurocapsales cyanobacterium LEGE 06147]